MTSHTPGPWGANTEQSEHHDLYARVIFDQTGHPIGTASDFNNTDRDAEVDANARLMAAAPELLAALEAILRRLTDAEADMQGIDREDAWRTRAGIPPWLERIAAPVLAKAKGVA